MTISTPTRSVMAIGQINFTGNVIPASWWRHITLPSGRPDQTAITLLSEIVYWYRPAEVRNEVTGALMGYRKRFHGDKLQRSYQAFADQFGFSKREATDALKRLKGAGFITLELRTVQTSEGMTLSNVLFVEPVPEAINDINSMTRKSDAKNATPVPSERNTPSVPTEPLPLSDVGDPTLKSETYTEITTQITTEIKNTIGTPADAAMPSRPAKQEYSPEFETAWQAYPKRAGGNPKHSAWKHWNARLREGITPEAMLEGVKRYAAFVTATGKLGTEYVKQAATFFGPDRHFEEPWQAPPAPAGGRGGMAPVSGFREQDYGESSYNW
ncbi:replication protein [Candidatus Symbiopectobacterium sp. NZEC127]|uniref:replication protein n=1 Tax=Candidatus Symbiopectobacterium sp. NZEC127 TaxID=2820472 RepID=UPI0022265C16|nr:replication protein [Candidatus Symbiopectobacterium sp. NZEC127]MCW2485744.1 replication protein [Candidatus Symbiopectobacterium sp. NZEC127]